MAKYVVGTVDEIALGSRKIVEVGGRSIGVFNVNGEYFALLNRCPHQAGPLCKGNAYGVLKSGAVGEYEYSRPGEIVRCPWHGWEFDVRTGQSWFDPVQVRVRRYDVTVAPGSAMLVEGSDELVAEGAAPPPEPGTTPAEVAAATGGQGETEPGMEGMVKGPYVAETYPVTVEQEYVVVEIGR
jgi:nitrite reductase/ring-hydroxylating ferredoxin subunit